MGFPSRSQATISNGLSFQQAYTWSKAIDDDSAIRDHAGDTQFPQNPYNATADRGLSIFHIEQRSVTSWVYELPVGKGRHFLNQGGPTDWVLGGWYYAGFMTLQSGFPVNLSSGCDCANIGESGYERPSYTGLPVKGSPQNNAHWINKNAFVQPGNAAVNPAYGDVGRNVILQPWFADADMNIAKRFTVHEKSYFELRFEGFNTTDHPNFGFYNTTLTSNLFGSITSAGSMRILQLGLNTYSRSFEVRGGG